MKRVLNRTTCLP